MKDRFEVYQANTEGVDYVCGDIHGCYDKLEIELSNINFNYDIDRLFVVGDLTDRGPYSTRAMDFLQKPWFHSVLGNHEDIILQCYLYKAESIAFHLRNGGHWFQFCSEEWKSKYIDLIKELPLIIKVDDYLIVHASFPENYSWENMLTSMYSKELKNYILWNRYMIDIKCEDIKKIYAGHTISPEFITYGKLESIDTGAFVHEREGLGKLTIKKLGE